MIELGIPAVLAALGWTFIVYRIGVIVGRNSRDGMDLSGPPVPPRPLPQDVRTQVLDTLAAGRKIDAIRLVRKSTGMGLKDSRLYVEAMQRE